MEFVPAAFQATFWIVVAVAIGLVIDRYLLMARHRAERAADQKTIDELRPLAFIDELTQIGNRRLFERQVETAVAHALRAEEPIALLAIDLNDLKVVNDARGHAVGDRLIQAIASVLKNSIRPTDSVSRVGGDEFCVLLPDCAEDKIDVVVQRIIANLATAQVVDGDARISVRASIGGTRLYTKNGIVFVGGIEVGRANARSVRASAQKLLVDTGDRAMYLAKMDKRTVESPVVIL